jgi:hypothetical protein
VLCWVKETSKEPSKDGAAEGTAESWLRTGPAEASEPTSELIRELCRSSSRVFDHARSPTARVLPPELALAPRNCTSPKSASRSVEQSPRRVHTDGASTIHSAEERSGFPPARVLEARAPVVRSRIRSVTCRTPAVAEATTRSPGCTAIFNVMGAAGRISSQAA